MSQTHTTASTNFQLIINNALDNYKKCTKNDLITHPLTAQLQSCNSPSDVLAVLHQQVHELDYSRTDERWSKWLDPTVNVIYVLSSTLTAGVTMVCLKTWTSRRSANSYILQVFHTFFRYSHLRMSYLLGSGSSFQCIFFFLLSCRPF